MHTPHIDGPDDAGHYGWHCACGETATGYETDAEATVSAGAHGTPAGFIRIPLEEV